MRPIVVFSFIHCLAFFATQVSYAEAISPATATDPAGLRVQPGFAVELLYSVPASEQGSWVSLTTDPQGRLITSDQLGQLYRVTPSPLGKSDVERVEKIDVNLGSAQGLLYAFDSLYVMVNQSKTYDSGLYRVRDTNRDDQFDSVELLQKLKGRGEHGPHGIVLSPDGQSLYVIAGNNTDLPNNISTYRLPKTWQEDQLLPRNPASSGHNTGRLAPGGWVCRVSPEGKDWELVATGFRNPYDLAINEEGELFTFDADMEHDIGAPWYRPTRVCHVVSGAEFGWRYGTGKWPAYFPDSVPPTLDVGLGSPTGVVFGYGAEFPQKYENALYVCDWTHGRLFAVHLNPMGASYSAEVEEFIAGTPLPLTDIVVNPTDRAMYFTIGGRKTQSGLYRVTWQGTGEAAVKQASNTSRRTADLSELRKQLEALHAEPRPKSLDFIWQHLGHPDRFVRYAARIALEHLDAKTWSSRLSAELDPETTISALLALARMQAATTDTILAEAIPLWNQDLTDRQRVDWLRTLAVTFARNGHPGEQAADKLNKLLESSYPQDTTPLDHELCKMLSYLNSEVVVPRSLALMRSAKTQESMLSYAMSLRVVTNGWTDQLRRDYLRTVNDAEVKATTGEFAGGGHLQTLIQRLRRDAVERIPDDQLAKFSELTNPVIVDAAEIGSPTPRKFIRRWTVADLTPHLDKVEQGRSFKNGKKLFRVAACASCHRFKNQGGIFGPDLTAVAKRYSRQVLLREIVEPSVQVSDQYQTHNILTDGGVVHSGRILDRGEKTWTVAVDPKMPSAVIEIPADEIEDVVSSTVSMMPQNLLDTFSRKEILDLFAYLESGGDPNHAAYAE